MLFGALHITPRIGSKIEALDGHFGSIKRSMGDFKYSNSVSNEY